MFTALFPQATIHRLDGVDHYCFEDAPEVIAAHITTFLQQT
jgi:haloalkane dehalogenase